MKKQFWIVTISLFILCSLSESQAVESEIGKKIAQAYGIEDFDEVIELSYTFNAKIGHQKVKRSWAWMPKENKVRLLEIDGVKQDVSYNRDILSKDPDKLKEVDSWFINDQYWLVFPFHLVWDEGIRVEVDEEKVNLPLGSGLTTRVKVIYPDTGGYTPGDVYELYIDENYMILQWIYRRGGADEPTRVSTWEDNQKFGPIIISLDHKGVDENFRVWFTDVEVKTD